MDEKIKKQLPKRGWTEKEVRDLIDNSPEKKPARDTRRNKDGSRKDEPATVHIDKDGNYVVTNDKIGEVVQVKNKNNPDWTPTHHE